jgi:hypothetical protein
MRFWIKLRRANGSLSFECCNDFHQVFQTINTFLNYLYKCKFDKANIILENGEQLAMQRVAAMPTAHVHALIQHHDLDEIVML